MLPSLVLTHRATSWLLLISILMWNRCLASANVSAQSDETVVPFLPAVPSGDQVREMGQSKPAVTTGRCSAILPDGRLQTVVYTCAPTGYSAVVQYRKRAKDGVNPEANDTLTPIAEILFRPTGEPSGTVTARPSASTAPPTEVVTKRRKNVDSTTGLTPPPRHRLRGTADQMSSLQLDDSAALVSTTTARSAAMAAGRGRNSRVSTEPSITEPRSTTAATVRPRTRWNAPLRRRIHSNPDA